MILAIDTSLGTAVAVVDLDGVVRGEESSANTLGHAELIGTLIADVLAQASVPAAAITHVAAGMGPGPFTGLRIGIAAARAFALAREVPVVAVPSHDAAALAEFERGGSVGMLRPDPAAAPDGPAAPAAGPAPAAPAAGPAAPAAPDGPTAPLRARSSAGTPLPAVAVVTDARRREFAYTIYTGLTREGLPLRSTLPALAPRDELDSRLAEQGAPRRVDTSEISAGVLGRIAARMIAAGPAETAIDGASAEPLYLRSPDVTLGHTPKRVGV